MPRVAGIGSALFDIILYSEAFPKEDTKQEASATVLQGGGPCSTAIVAVSKLGIDASFIGTVSDDMFGRFVRDDLVKWGVDTTYLKTVSGHETAHSAVICSGRRRTCVYALGDLPSPSPNEFDLRTALKDTEVLHLDGYNPELALAAADIVHGNGGLVSIDAGTMRPGIDELLAISDVIIASEAFAEKLTGKDVEEAVIEIDRRYSPKASVVTAGPRGGVIADGGKARWYAEFPADVVDSNGAGDVFHGAFIVAMLHGFDPFGCCQFSSAVSALKCMKRGAREGVPSYAEAIRFFRECGDESEEEVFGWKS